MIRCLICRQSKHKNRPGNNAPCRFLRPEELPEYVPEPEGQMCVWRCLRCWGTGEPERRPGWLSAIKGHLADSWVPPYVKVYNTNSDITVYLGTKLRTRPKKITTMKTQTIVPRSNIGQETAFERLDPRSRFGIVWYRIGERWTLVETASSVCFKLACISSARIF